MGKPALRSAGRCRKIVLRIRPSLPNQVGDGNRKPVASRNREQQRQRQRAEEEHAHPETSDAKAEVQKHDANADRNAIGHDPDPPDIAVVSFVEVTAGRAMTVRFVPADEQRAFAAVRAMLTPPPAYGLAELCPGDVVHSRGKDTAPGSTRKASGSGGRRVTSAGTGTDAIVAGTRGGAGAAGSRRSWSATDGK